MKTQKKLWSALAALCVATVTVAQPAYNYSKLQKEQLGRGVVNIINFISLIYFSL